MHRNVLAVVAVAIGLAAQEVSVAQTAAHVTSAMTAGGHAAAACPWPAKLDALTAAPGIHKVIFENEHVRVLQVMIPPHSREPIHTHCRPSTLYIEQAGDIIDRDADGRVLFDSRQLKEKPKAPFVEWSAAQPPHSVENLDDAPMKLIRVENKD